MHGRAKAIDWLVRAICTYIYIYIYIYTALYKAISEQAFKYGGIIARISLLRAECDSI